MSSVGSLALLVVFAGLVGTVWVFADAGENSSQSTLLWGTVALLGGLLGVLLYVLVGRDAASSNDRSGSRSEPTRGTAKLTHRCETCGEKFHSPHRDVGSCRNCGGIKIEEV